MKLIFPAVVLGALSPWAIAAEPTPPPSEAWVNEVMAAKPYQLEVRYGETFSAFAEAEAHPGSGRVATPTLEFLRQARHVSAAVAENDEGSVVTSTAAVTYDLGKDKNGKFSFRFSCILVEGGTYTMNGSVFLAENEWVVLSSNRAQEPGHPPHYFYAAVRIRKRS